MSKHVLECKGVEKHYDDGSRVLKILDGVDLAVVEGEILAISGPSGVGKSTLLQLMGTLDRPTGGEIYFHDRPISKMARAEINRIRNHDIGFVFQFYHLLPEFTALENVMMPGLAGRRSRVDCIGRAEGLLEKVGLRERMTHKPGQLSGGEQQRVAIARALFNEPGVMLCDEPTGNLDETTGHGIVELLFELNATEQATFVMVTHDDSLAARADRWIQIHDGQARPQQ